MAAVFLARANGRGHIANQAARVLPGLACPSLSRGRASTNAAMPKDMSGSLLRLRGKARRIVNQSLWRVRCRERLIASMQSSRWSRMSSLSQQYGTLLSSNRP